MTNWNCAVNESNFDDLVHQNASEKMEYSTEFNGALLHLTIWPLVGSILCLIAAFILFLNRRLRCIRARFLLQLPRSS